MSVANKKLHPVHVYVSSQRTGVQKHFPWPWKPHYTQTARASLPHWTHRAAAAESSTQQLVSSPATEIRTSMEQGVTVSMSLRGNFIVLQPPDFIFKFLF